MIEAKSEYIATHLLNEATELGARHPLLLFLAITTPGSPGTTATPACMFRFHQMWSSEFAIEMSAAMRVSSDAPLQ